MATAKSSAVGKKSVRKKLTKQAAALSNNPDPCRGTYIKAVQNILLIWLDSNIHQKNNAGIRENIRQLERVVNTVEISNNADECVQFLEDNFDEKTYMVISSSLAEHIVPCIHEMSQIDSIFIFCQCEAYHEDWTGIWPKIKGIFTKIDAIYGAIKQATEHCEYSSIPFSLLATSGDEIYKNLDRLNCTFMYTKILKEILLTIDFNQEHINEFIQHCRIELGEDKKQLKYVDEMEEKYREKTPIQWYTYECFLNSMLNRVLRLMNISVILKLGFFINDLHRDIEMLHRKQFVDYTERRTFIVCRGQTVSKTDFVQLQKTKGGLISFNSFLSTSRNPDVSLSFAKRNLADRNLVGVLFVMNIDPSKSSTPFASIADMSYFKREEEVLFSMHTIFRIQDVQPLDDKARLYQVDLTLTKDDDPDLCELTDRIREETKGASGWSRLAKFLIKTGQFEKAEQVYEALLRQTMTEQPELGYIYNQLGKIKHSQGNHKDALKFYNKSVDIYEKILSKNDLKLASPYNNIGTVYAEMDDYSKALFYYERALTIRKQLLTSQHPDVSASYNNIGLVHQKMGDYSKALLFHEKALAIRQQSLPSNHPHLATSHNNIGLMYSNIGDYSKALASHRRALAIRQQSLPSNHPDLTMSYNNIGNVHVDIGNYSKALSYYERSLAIRQESLPSDHPDFAQAYNNIGTVYGAMGNYSEAQSFYERAVDIAKRSLGSNHSSTKQYKSNLDIIRKKL